MSTTGGTAGPIVMVRLTPEQFTEWMSFDPRVIALVAEAAALRRENAELREQVEQMKASGGGGEQ